MCKSFHVSAGVNTAYFLNIVFDGKLVLVLLIFFSSVLFLKLNYIVTETVFFHLPNLSHLFSSKLLICTKSLSTSDETLPARSASLCQNLTRWDPHFLCDQDALHRRIHYCVLSAQFFARVIQITTRARVSTTCYSDNVKI